VRLSAAQATAETTAAHGGREVQWSSLNVETLRKKLKSCITWGIFGRICDDSEKSIRKFKSPQSKPTFGMIWSRGTCGFECRVACASLILGLLGLACLLCRDLSEGAPSRVLLNETVNL